MSDNAPENTSYCAWAALLYLDRLPGLTSFSVVLVLSEVRGLGPLCRNKDTHDLWLHRPARSCQGTA